MTSPGPLPGAPTHYEVLGLPRDALDDGRDKSSSTSTAAMLVKRAYHRALLRHHPDKTAAAAAGPVAQPRERSSAAFSIDQIAHAFTVLSDPEQRADYDRAVLLAAAAAGGPAANGQSGDGFQTGVDDADLDDLAYDPAGGGRWHRGCRCGNEQGYVFAEADLDGGCLRRRAARRLPGLQSLAARPLCCARCRCPALNIY